MSSDPQKQIQQWLPTLNGTNWPVYQTPMWWLPVKPTMPKYDISGIAWITKPAITGIEKTQISKMPVETQKKIANDVTKKEVKPAQQQEIPANIEVKQEMGTSFNNITLDQENTLKQRLKQDFPDLTPEQRFSKAQDIVKWWEQRWVIKQVSTTPERDLAWAPMIVKKWYDIMDKWTAYEWLWWPIIRWVSNFFAWLLQSWETAWQWLDNIFRRWKEVSEDAIKSDVVMSKFKEQYGRFPDSNNEYDNMMVENILKDIETDPQYKTILEEKKQEQANIDAVPIQKSILDVAEWWFNTALTIVAPEAMSLLPVAAETKYWGKVLEWMWNVISFGWSVINKVPWLKDFRDNLEPQDQERFDALVWNSALLFLWWAKYKWQKVTDPVKFVSDNINPADVITTFKDRVYSVPKKVVEAPSKIKSKIKDSFVKDKTKWVDNVDRLASNIFGMDAETISTMRKNPEILKKIDEWTITKEWIKEDLLKMVDEVESQKWDVWKQYKSLYENKNTYKTDEIVSTLTKQLKEKWIVFDDAGKISTFDITNKALAQTPQWELSLIKSQYNLLMDSLRDKQVINIEQLHNIKKNLGNAQYTEWVATKRSPILREMSNVVNENLKEVPWWKEIDLKFTQKAEELRNISKLVETKQWEFKWTLKALLWERQYERLQKLEEVYPWLTEKLETIKAYDDYLRTRETQKVWVYGKMFKWAAGWSLWAWLWYAVGGEVWAMIWWFLGAVVSNNLTDPKLFKDFIIKKVEWWPKIVEKLNRNQQLTDTEKQRVVDAVMERKPEPYRMEWEPVYKPSFIDIWQQKSLPYKLNTNEPIVSNMTNPIVKPNWLKKAWPTKTKESLPVKEDNQRLPVKPVEWWLTPLKQEPKLPIKNESIPQLKASEDVKLSIKEAPNTKEIKLPVKKEFETLPKEESIYDEAKKIWAKRISPEKITHQQLTPEAWIRAMTDKEIKRFTTNRDAFSKMAEESKELAKVYWDKMPTRAYANSDKYPNFNEDYAKRWRIKENLWKFGGKDFASAIENMEYRANMWDRMIADKTSIMEKAKNSYIEQIKSDISKWYKYPEDVLNYDKSFRIAVDNRARYEKWLATSFSADDARIVFDDKKQLWAWLKRQDWKELTQIQKSEIIDWVIEFGDNLWLDMKKLAETDRWVYVHLNDKNPFLMKNTAWLYRKWENNVSISVWGTESFKTLVDWKEVSKRVNTTMSHELWHAIDSKVWWKLFDNWFLFDRKLDMNPSSEFSPRWNKYWKSDREVTARMIEQYVAIKQWHIGYFDRPAYWKKEVFETKIQPTIEKTIKDKLWDFMQENKGLPIKQ